MAERWWLPLSERGGLAAVIFRPVGALHGALESQLGDVSRPECRRR